MAAPRPFLYPSLDERLLLVEHLAEFSEQPILIKGPAGSGKSRVARYLADPERHPHWRPVLIDGATRPNRVDLLPILYTALDVGSLPPGGAQAQAEAAMSALRQRLAYLRHIRQTPLLLLDDAQLLPPDTLEFLTLLAATGGARLCLFSETPLQLSIDPDREPTQAHQLDLPPLAPQDLPGFAEYLQETGQLTTPSLDLSAAPPDRLLALHKTTAGRPAALIAALQASAAETGPHTSGPARAPRPVAALLERLRDRLPKRKARPATPQAPAAADASRAPQPTAHETETFWFDAPKPNGDMDSTGRDQDPGLRAADLAARFEPSFDDGDFEPEVALSRDASQAATSQSADALAPVGTRRRLLDARWVGGFVAVFLVVAAVWWRNSPPGASDAQTRAAGGADPARAANGQARNAEDWASTQDIRQAKVQADGSVLLPLPAADASRLPTVRPAELGAEGPAAGFVPEEIAGATTGTGQDIATSAKNNAPGETSNAPSLPIEPPTPAGTEVREARMQARTGEQKIATAAASSNADGAAAGLQRVELELPLPEFAPERPGIVRPQSATLARSGTAPSGQSDAPWNGPPKGAAKPLARTLPNTLASAELASIRALAGEENALQGAADIPNAFREGTPVDNPGGWFIQLLGSRDPATIDRFTARRDLPQPVFVARTRYRDSPWFIVLIGGIEDRVTANSVLANLPDYLKKTNPWPRTGASLEDAELRALTP